MRFFSAGGTGGTVSSSRQNAAKSFRCAIFQLAGTGGNVWTSLAWNEHLRVSAGVADPRFKFSAIHSDTRVTNKASAKISHGTLSSEILNT